MIDRTFIPVDNVGRRWHNDHFFVCSSSTTRLASCDELREKADTNKMETSDEVLDGNDSRNLIESIVKKIVIFM